MQAVHVVFRAGCNISHSITHASYTRHPSVWRRTPTLKRHFPNLPGQWLQCQAKDSDVYRVHRLTSAGSSPDGTVAAGKAELGRAEHGTRGVEIPGRHGP